MNSFTTLNNFDDDDNFKNFLFFPTLIFTQFCLPPLIALSVHDHRHDFLYRNQSLTYSEKIKEKKMIKRKIS